MTERRSHDDAEPPAVHASSSSSLGYVPALDGLRGLAVAAVLLFHADVPGVRGGHLGVTAFFTLSGFLITTLLLLERRATGRVDLAAFWRRRARRLVPAALLCLPLVAVIVHLSPTPAADGVVGDAVASALWVANWRFIVDEQTYADLFALPSPLQHFWSLAVEEQFYLIFPLLLVALLGRAAAPRVRSLALVLGGLTVLSTLQLARLHEAGGGLGRAYYGTDARVAELLVGALVALALIGPAGLRSPGRWAGPLGFLGLTGLLGALALVEKGDPLLYRGGLLAVAGCTAAVILAALRADSVVSRLLQVGPLVGLGVLSYGVYLFHWPLFLLLDESFTGSDPISLFLIRVMTAVGLAWVSYELIERPVRDGTAFALLPRTSWAAGAAAGLTAVAVAAGQISLPLPGPRETVPPTALQGPQALPTEQVAGAAGGAPGAGPGTAASRAQPLATPAAAGQAVRQQAVGRSTAVTPTAARPARRAAAPAEFSRDPGNTAVPPVPQAPPGAVRVVVVGDSIGNNLGQGLRAWADGRDDVVVYNLAVPACPISRGGERRLGPDLPFPVDPACRWWDDAGSERAEALAEFTPDVVVLQDGVNEVFDRRLPEWDDWKRPGDPQLDSWLVREYRAALQTWNARLVLTNAPCGDWDRYEHFDDLQDPELRLTALNARVYPGVQNAGVADLFQRLCPNGRYSDEVEGVPNGRPDGFHLTLEASTALARNWLGPLVLEAAAAQEAPLG